jgi:hypothetical protein
MSMFVGNLPRFDMFSLAGELWVVGLSYPSRVSMALKPNHVVALELYS